MVGNKSKVEASIINAYIQVETSFLSDDYLGPDFVTNSRRLRRNEVVQGPGNHVQVSIFNYPGASGSVSARRRLDDEEYLKAVHYILTNTPEFEEYFEIFYHETKEQHPHFDGNETYNWTVSKFPAWLKNHVPTHHSHNETYFKHATNEVYLPVQIYELGNTHVIYEWICSISMGFDWRVTCSTTYKVNNYKFHTESHSEGRPTTNCYVYVRGTEGEHFYGIIEEIMHVRCKFNTHIRVVLFKCRWYDPKYVKEYPSAGIVQLNTKRMYLAYDPFILAQQAVQVYFTDFPGCPTLSAEGWVAVCRVKPTNTIEVSLSDLPFQEDGEHSSQMPIVSEVESVTGLADEYNYQYTEGEQSVETDSNESSPNEMSDDDI